MIPPVTVKVNFDENFLNCGKNNIIEVTEHFVGGDFLKILVETSARHIHLNKKDFEILFGENAQPTIKKELSQPGQFACVEKVNIIGARDEIKNVAILGPFRDQTQVEVSLTDARKLGIAAPIRDSGDLNDTPGCTLVGPNGSLKLAQGVIVARRHIHLDPTTALKFKLKAGQLVKVKISSEFRSLIFDNVRVCISENFLPAMHIDTDEANAAGITSEIYGEILI